MSDRVLNMRLHPFLLALTQSSQHLPGQKVTIKTPERRHWDRSGVFVVNFKHISQLVLMFLLLILNM